MALVFYECTQEETARAHRDLGGKDLHQFRASLRDGFLRVMSAKEPIAPNVFQHHVSISVGPVQGLPYRKATDEEVKEVLSLWSLVTFEEDNDGASDPKVRNFWEKA